MKLRRRLYLALCWCAYVLWFRLPVPISCMPLPIHARMTERLWWALLPHVGSWAYRHDYDAALAARASREERAT